MLVVCWCLERSRAAGREEAAGSQCGQGWTGYRHLGWVHHTDPAPGQSHQALTLLLHHLVEGAGQGPGQVKVIIFSVKSCQSSNTVSDLLI